MVYFLWRISIDISLLFNFDVQKKVLRNMTERPNMDHFKANFKHYSMSTTRLQPSTHLVGPWPSTWLGYGHQVPALVILVVHTQSEYLDSACWWRPKYMGNVVSRAPFWLKYMLKLNPGKFQTNISEKLPKNIFFWQKLHVYMCWALKRLKLAYRWPVCVITQADTSPDYFIYNWHNLPYRFMLEVLNWKKGQFSCFF